MDIGQSNGEAPPPGTAIVRPLRYVQAVRDRHAQQFTDPAQAAASRAARAWPWALGESTIAPVTDRSTTVPPTRSDIEAEIEVADERRANGDRENRADAAAAILRWLIGDDDHVPVRCENRGELVDGFGDVVRMPEHIAEVLALTEEGRRQTAASVRDLAARPEDRRLAEQRAIYLDAVAATLTWVLGQRPETPITRATTREPTTRNLKAERVHAEDVINQARTPSMGDGQFPAWYGEAVKHSIDWLLGDSRLAP